MNGTLLSHIVWVMFLAHHCLPKVSRNCQKKAKVDFRILIKITIQAQTNRAGMTKHGYHPSVYSLYICNIKSVSYTHLTLPTNREV